MRTISLIAVMTAAALAGCQASVSDTAPTTDGARLRPGFDAWKRPVTTSSSEAQAFIAQGMQWLYGFNDDEVLQLLEYARALDLEIRFIEYMDVGGATRWNREDVVTRAELLRQIGERYGRVEPLDNPDHPAAPAERFALRDAVLVLPK